MGARDAAGPIHPTADISLLWACVTERSGHSPAFGVLVIGYLVGQLGGLVPIPGGIGGTEGGLIGAFALFHVPLAASTVAVLAYHAVVLWIADLLGSLAFVAQPIELPQVSIAGG